MLSGEEVMSLAHTIISSCYEKVKKPQRLREILQEALTEFDETLKTVTPAEREATLSLFLERIRETAFDFRLAVLYVTLKDDFLGEGKKFDSETFLKRCHKDGLRIARLFRFL